MTIGMRSGHDTLVPPEQADCLAAGRDRRSAAFPLPPLAEQAVLFLRRLAAMQPDARDVARTWGAGAASRDAFAAGREPREEPRGELVHVVGQRVGGGAAGDEPGAGPSAA